MYRPSFIPSTRHSGLRVHAQSRDPATISSVLAGIGFPLDALTRWRE
jgi:hypothetical protein